MSLGLITLVAYLALLTVHAFRGLRSSDTPAGYHVAGRRMSGVVVGLSFFATFLSTNSLIGLAGRSSRDGLSTYLIGGLFVVFTWASWRLVAPRLRRESERHGALSLAEYLGAAYRSVAYRRALAAIVVLAAIPYTQAVLKGGALVMVGLTGLDPAAALAVLWIVVVAYTLIGGFHAVASTDAVQGVLMLVIAVLLPVALIQHGGGLFATVDTAAAAIGRSRGDLLDIAPLGVMIGMGCAGGFKLLAEPRQVSRFFAIDATQVARGRRVCLLALSVAYLFLLPVGLFAAVYFGQAPDDPDQLVPRLLEDAALVPPWLGAIGLVALLAAAMSSIDSSLLVVGAAIWRDLIAPGRGPGRIDELAATRVAILLFSVVPTVLAWRSDAQILELTTFAGGLYGAAILPPLLMALHRDRPDTSSAWAATVAGSLTLLVWPTLVDRWVPGLRPVHEVIAGAAASTAALLLASRRARRAPLG